MENKDKKNCGEFGSCAIIIEDFLDNDNEEYFSVYRWIPNVPIEENTTDDVNFTKLETAREYAVSLLKKYKGSYLSDSPARKQISPRNTYNESDIICPYCGEIQDSDKLFSGFDEISEAKEGYILCNNPLCNMEFKWEGRVFVSFTTRKQATDVFEAIPEYKEVCSEKWAHEDR